MEMTAREITANYKAAKNPKSQINILADLNDTNGGEIVRILLENGIENIKTPKEQPPLHTLEEHAKETPRETPGETPKETPKAPKAKAKKKATPKKQTAKAQTPPQMQPQTEEIIKIPIGEKMPPELAERITLEMIRLTEESDLIYKKVKALQAVLDLYKPLTVEV